MLGWLAEDPLPTIMAGAVALTLLLVVYIQLRARWPLIGIAVTLLLMVGGVAIERLVVTPREEVTATLHRLANAVEANDLPEVLRLISSSADDVRQRVETLMPRVTVAKANIVSTPEIAFAIPDDKEASVSFRAFVEATAKRSGMKGGLFDDVVVQFRKEGANWRVVSYTTQKKWSVR